MYKLINKQTGEEHICQKVTIDGMDYYVSDEKILTGDYKYHHVTGLRKALVDGNYTNQKKVIATNNPNIDVPKVVDEVDILAFRHVNPLTDFLTKKEFNCMKEGFMHGYNKSQETHPFSEEDMKSFGKFCIENNFCKEENRYYQYWELLQLWKEQQPKIVYYESN